MIRITLLVIFFTISVVANATIQQDAYTHIADYKYWSIYKTKDNVKYMVSYPISESGTFVKRKKPYFMISNFEDTVEASTSVGYYYKKQSSPKVSVKNKDPKNTISFLFNAVDTLAWNSDQKVIESMKNGLTMTVFSESRINTNATDTYSLEGFTEAYEEIMKK